MCSSSLKTRNPTENGLGLDGCKPMTWLLQNCKVLTKVDLTHNHVENRGGGILGVSLKQNETFNDIELGH